MNFDQPDLILIAMLAVLGISVLVAIVVIAKTFVHDSKESKEKASKFAETRIEETGARNVPHKPAAPAKTKTKPKPAATPVHKDDVDEGDDLVAAAEVYLTYELKEQAVTSLEKHLLMHPADKKAIAMLKKAKASD